MEDDEEHAAERRDDSGFALASRTVAKDEEGSGVGGVGVKTEGGLQEISEG